jgi:plasmid stabilization system protein ParE
MKVRYRRRAQLDIDNIHEYIARQSPRAATEVAARIRDAADRLDGRIWDTPGRARDTYEWVVGGLPYIIVYEVDKARDAIAILAVFHGVQDRDQG